MPSISTLRQRQLGFASVAAATALVGGLFSISSAGAQTSTACGMAPAGMNVIESDDAIIYGTSGADYICAGTSENTIYGYAGNDIINAKGGADVIFAGEGNDLVKGRYGNDTIFGGPGNDFLFGQKGADTIYGGTGNDKIHGGGGPDQAFGGDGADQLIGWYGNDVLNGNLGPDTLVGGWGADTLLGGYGNDTLLGGYGNDSLDGGPGTNTLDAGAGQIEDTDPPAETEVPPAEGCEAIAALFAAGPSVNAQLADPESSATCDGETITVTSNGIPDYTYIRTSPGDPNAREYSFEIPAEPTPAAETTEIPLLGDIAVTLTGIPIYGATEGTGGDVLSLEGTLSVCGSHNGPTGFHIHLLGTSELTDCLFTPAEVAASPQLVGYAFDGYPIYTGNDQYTSSWQLTNDTLFATATWSAHTYVEGSGDLDECNGRTDDDGNYAYYTTDTFPYTLGCYTGVVDAAVTAGPGAGPDGGTPPGGR